MSRELAVPIGSFYENTQGPVVATNVRVGGVPVEQSPTGPDSVSYQRPTNPTAEAHYQRYSTPPRSGHSDHNLYVDPGTFISILDAMQKRLNPVDKPQGVVETRKPQPLTRSGEALLALLAFMVIEQQARTERLLRVKVR